MPKMTWYQCMGTVVSVVYCQVGYFGSKWSKGSKVLFRDGEKLRLLSANLANCESSIVCAMCMGIIYSNLSVLPVYHRQPGSSHHKLGTIQEVKGILRYQRDTLRRRRVGWSNGPRNPIYTASQKKTVPVLFL